MADQKPDQKTSGVNFILIIIALLLIVGGGLFYFDKAPEQSGETLGEISESIDEAVEGVIDETAEAVEDVTSETTTAETSEIDFALAKTERILGDRSAPIKITEHSSFSCGHCAKFHQNTYPEFKAKYIDTGKAYIVFSDFPLNAPALHASLIGRCLPDQDRYFDYVQELFVNQNDWAYDAATYLNYLKEKAGEYGLDEDGVNACLKNEDLQKSLLDRINAVQQRYEVRSTPSFVINNQKVITGALSFADFEAALNAALEEIKAESASPSTDEGTATP